MAKAISTSVAFAGLLAGACSKDSPPANPTPPVLQSESRTLTPEELIERERKITEEVTRIASEKARIQADATDRRGSIAEELAARTEAVEVKRREMIEAAAREQVRRQELVIAVRDFVDTIIITQGRIEGGQIRYLIGAKLADNLKELRSPQGLTVKYLGREGDYFVFEFDDSQFSIQLRRPSDGLSNVTFLREELLPNGVPYDKVLHSAPAKKRPREGEHETSGTTKGLIVHKALWGAGQTLRDVTSLVRDRAASGRLSMSAQNQEFGGDPAFGQVKFLYIKYSINGRIVEKTFREGDRVTIP
jgi:hypothetical protein